MKLELAARAARQNISASDKRSRKSSSVYQDMKQQILIGALTPDSPITEQSLAQDYGCSQSTIREALLILQEDGLVVRRGYKGTYITETSNEEAVVMMRLRNSIESAAVERVIQNITPRAMAELRELAAAYDVCRQNKDAFCLSESDIAFHVTLLRIADMPVLEPILLRTLLHLHRFVLTRHNGSMLWVTDVTVTHSDILDAIEDGDTPRARQLITDHTTTSTIEITPEIRKVVVEKAMEEMD